MSRTTFDYGGRTAIVTGAARGIGLYITGTVLPVDGGMSM